MVQAVVAPIVPPKCAVPADFHDYEAMLVTTPAVSVSKVGAYLSGRVYIHIYIYIYVYGDNFVARLHHFALDPHMHILDVVIVMHILDNVILMHIFDGVIFIVYVML